jgi:GAGA factor
MARTGVVQKMMKNQLPPERWRTQCPLCLGLFRDWSTRRSHLLLEHFAKPGLVGCAVGDMLEEAPEVPGLFVCWICPMQCAMWIDKDDYMLHLFAVHHCDPEKIEQYSRGCECEAWFS